MQATNGKPAEQKLIRLYMDLTGEPEAAARAVYMYVCGPVEEAPLRSAPNSVANADRPVNGSPDHPRYT